MTRIALKIDVDTLRGTLEGVPALVDLLKRRGVGATFLFSLGPDNTGRALRRIFRRGFLSKVLRTSVAANYGVKTLCYGTLLPPPDIGARGRDVMRSVRDAGFEVGVHCYDHILWQDYVAERDYTWTQRQMRLAVDAFHRVFGEAPKVHGAAGWQVNEHVPRLEAEFAFDFASDTRGSGPFRPLVAGSPAKCPQLPTTLPTFDELIGRAGCTEHNVADVLFERSRESAQHGHVFTLHAELEGMRLRRAFECLLERWISQGLKPCSMREVYRQLPSQLPLCAIERSRIEGRSGVVASQGADGSSSSYSGTASIADGWRGHA